MPPPAWYHDPVQPGLFRWWDGYRWTEHTRPIPVGGHTPLAVNPPSPTVDFANETKAGRRARTALYAAIPFYSAQFVMTSFLSHDLVAAFRQFLRDNNDPNKPFKPLHLPRVDRILFPLSELLGLATWVIGIVFIIWLYRAAVVASRAGIPAKREPVWAILGFILPVINFWFPYQVARDLTPAGHPARRQVIRWWTFWNCVTAGNLVLLAVAILAPDAGYVVAALMIGLVCWTAVLARRLISEVGAYHAEALGFGAPQPR